jgi:SAM-dependent methyltransferase
MHRRHAGNGIRLDELLETAADPIEVFRADWRTYQTAIRENYMFHRDISTAIRKLLDQLHGPLKVLDLGCGDASQIPEIFKPGQVAEYRGCDLSAQALDVAHSNLAHLGNRAELLCRDMLEVLRESPVECYDIVYSSYALHHLPSDEKQEFLNECRRTLGADGILILVDIMREEGETLPEYFDRYIEKMDADWTGFSDIERRSIQDHIRSCDYPESPSVLQSLARNAGLKKSRKLEKRTWHQAWCFMA